MKSWGSWSLKNDRMQLWLERTPTAQLQDPFQENIPLYSYQIVTTIDIHWLYCWQKAMCYFLQSLSLQFICGLHIIFRTLNFFLPGISNWTKGEILKEMWPHQLAVFLSFRLFKLGTWKLSIRWVDISQSMRCFKSLFLFSFTA